MLPLGETAGEHVDDTFNSAIVNRRHWNFRVGRDGDPKRQLIGQVHGLPDTVCNLRASRHPSNRHAMLNTGPPGGRLMTGWRAWARPNARSASSESKGYEP